MSKGQWKAFRKLTGKCYENMAGVAGSPDCWDKAFEVLKDIVADGRSERADYASELYQLDEMTDFEYDVQGWLEDYLDELDMREEKGKVLKVCDTLLDMFRWKEDNPSEIRFMKAMALKGLGENAAAADFCRHWLEEEPDNIVAVTANVYAYTANGDMKEAEELIQEYIKEDTQCTEENDILFTAAAAYYKVTGNKKAYKRMDDALEAYDKYLEEFFLEDGKEEWFEWDDDDLPFN